jgi:hypothetical protein
MEPDIKWFAIMMIGVMLSVAFMTSITSYNKTNNTCWKLDSSTKTTFNQCTGEIKK